MFVGVVVALGDDDDDDSSAEFYEDCNVRIWVGVCVRTQCFNKYLFYDNFGVSGTVKKDVV